MTQVNTGPTVGITGAIALLMCTGEVEAAKVCYQGSRKMSFG
jgi:hypothetical protein